MRLMNLFLALAFATVAACGGPQNSTSAGGSAPAVSTGAAEITFKTDPSEPKMGENTFEVTVMQSGQPVNDAQVSVEFFMAAMPQMNMAEMRTKADLQPGGDGAYRGTGQVMMAGNWDVTIMAMRNGRELATKKLTVTAE